MSKIKTNIKNISILIMILALLPIEASAAETIVLSPASQIVTIGNYATVIAETNGLPPGWGIYFLVEHGACTFDYCDYFQRMVYSDSNGIASFTYYYDKQVIDSVRASTWSPTVDELDIVSNKVQVSWVAPPDGTPCDDGNPSTQIDTYQSGVCTGTQLYDTDYDGIYDDVDNCPSVSNPGQENADGDAYGDICDPAPLDPYNDIDGDGIAGNVDNCPTTYNPDQIDTDADTIGNACDLSPFGEDSTPPTTTDDTPIDWKNINFDVILSCTDNSGGSGCKETKYNIDGGVWNTGTLISITSDGDHTIQYYSTDNAGNTETTKTIHAKLDKIPPTITESKNPSPNQNGWNNGDVTVSFACSDGISGVASCTSSQIISTEGFGQSVTGTATDMGGNSASIVVGDINIDKTPPNVGVSRSPGPNSNEWNNGPVTVTFTATDALSGVHIPTEIVAMNLQGASQSITRRFEDKAGNVATGYVTGINIDLTPPTVTATPDRLPDSNVWYNHGLTISFTGVDSLSGIKDCELPRTYNGPDGLGVSASGSCTDIAGNTGIGALNFNYDATPPTITGSRIPLANSNGWNNEDVIVSFTCSDLSSPVISCPQGTTISTEDAGQSVTGTATDQADNSASATVGDINIDKTVPTITASASTIDGVYTSGTWTNKDVTVGFSCSDDKSGIESCSGPVVISGERAGQSEEGSTTDKAGNTASTTFSGINIDKTPPVITLNGNNEKVELGSTYIDAGATATDNFGGYIVVTSTGTVNTNAIGKYTITYSAVDSAGNSAEKTRIVDVIYMFTGFFQPVDNTPTLNSVKSGSAVPIKFSLNGYQGLNIFMTGYPVSKRIDCATNVALDDIEITETAGQSSLSYDDTTGQYKYVWKTDTGWTGTCRQLNVKLNDGIEHLGNFKFK